MLVSSSSKTTTATKFSPQSAEALASQAVQAEATKDAGSSTVNVRRIKLSCLYSCSRPHQDENKCKMLKNAEALASKAQYSLQFIAEPSIAFRSK